MDNVFAASFFKWKATNVNHFTIDLGYSFGNSCFAPLASLNRYFCLIVQENVAFPSLMNSSNY